MSCLSWNCCRFRNPQTEDELIALVTAKDPKLVFLMETKFEKYILERVGRRIQFTNLFVVPRVNTSGGLALYWKSDLDVDVQTFSNRHIDVIVNKEWMTPGVSQVSTEILILPAEKTLGVYFGL